MTSPTQVRPSHSLAVARCNLRFEAIVVVACDRSPATACCPDGCKPLETVVVTGFLLPPNFTHPVELLFKQDPRKQLSEGQ
jgi:hypothetical protein